MGSGCCIRLEFIIRLILRIENRGAVLFLFAYRIYIAVHSKTSINILKKLKPLESILSAARIFKFCKCILCGNGKRAAQIRTTSHSIQSKNINKRFLFRKRFGKTRKMKTNHSQAFIWVIRGAG